MTDFLLLVSKITPDGDCSHEIRRHFPLVRKAMKNPDSVLKSRDKGRCSQGYRLPTGQVQL